MNTFEQNVLNIWGEEGKKWLNKLPQLVTYYADKWELKALRSVKNLSYNYVLNGSKNGRPVILKFSFDHIALKREIAALEAYNDIGCAKLLLYDVDDGVVLLQKIIPGTSLKSFFPADDEKAVEIACCVMRQLHSAKVIDGFPTIKDWLAALEKDYAIPESHLHKARTMSEKLLATADNSVLLHGDLHHDNILFNGDDKWLAVDPKGVIGEPAYEVGAFIRNPKPDLLEQPNVAEIIKKRIDQFAHLLRLDQHRIRDWSYIQAVLAACWCIDDNLDPGYWLDIADVIGVIG